MQLVQRRKSVRHQNTEGGTRYASMSRGITYPFAGMWISEPEKFFVRPKKSVDPATGKMYKDRY